MVPAGIVVGQLGVVEAEQMQHLGMRIVQVDQVLDSNVVFFAATESHAALRSATGHSHGAAAVVEAPAVSLVDLLPRRTTGLGTLYDQGFVQHGALFQVGHMRRDRSLASALAFRRLWRFSCRSQLGCRSLMKRTPCSATFRAKLTGRPRLMERRSAERPAWTQTSYQ